jgi:hypothetical protein
VAVDRHMAAHPEDRDADVVLFHFCNIEEDNDIPMSARPVTPGRD